MSMRYVDLDHWRLGVAPLNTGLAGATVSRDTLEVPAAEIFPAASRVKA